MEGKDFTRELIKRYRDNKATQEELEAFFHLISEGELENELEEVMNAESVIYEERAPILPLYRRRWFRVAAAAAILVFLAGGAFFLLDRRSHQQQITKQQPTVPDIAPGGNKAVLTLADGSTIILDNAANGTLTQQGNTKVLKPDNGQLAYNSLNEKPTEVLYNTVTTPRGGQYQLTLSDGSKVWLNAASSLRFPANFAGNERRVELTGEGYFEIARNTSMPFKVNVAGKQEVEVLGTHFNINSYSDEANLNTTLLEGKIKVTATDNRLSIPGSRLLNPGQQAQLSSNGEILINKNADLEEVLAWKNGQFNFSSLDIQSIMRQISRWYDVDIKYEGQISKETYSGIVSRNSNVSQVLKIMEEGGIKFNIEGKKIVIKQ